MNEKNENYEEKDMNEPMAEIQAMETKQEEVLEWEAPAITQEAAVHIDRVEEPLPWLKSEEVEEVQSRWNSIQIEFVDDPRASVKQADELVAEALEKIEQAFSSQRMALDRQWNDQENDVSTEDLRVALQRYRSFLNRLLAL